MVYLHIPFCRRKCLYCDFYSVGGRESLYQGYVDALLREAEARLSADSGVEDPSSPRTIYIGGGTPSLLPPEEFRRLSSALLRLVPDPVEFTIEVNPDDVTPEMAAMWYDCGVNRISMGVQSLCDDELRLIGRRHDAAAARRAFDILARRFENISLDLIFGLPGQTMESLDATVAGFLEMSPAHISAYSLMYEERTALTRMRDAGSIRELPEGDSVDMFRLVSGRLADAGYERYELSNYALPGRRSIHNSAYWQGCRYVGLGPGAHSYDGARCRSFNIPDVRKYIDYWSGRIGAAPVEKEILTDDELREEMIMTRLRRIEGLSLEEFSQRFGAGELRRLQDEGKDWIKRGYLEERNGSLRLTDEGVMISDEIIAALF